MWFIHHESHSPRCQGRRKGERGSTRPAGKLNTKNSSPFLPFLSSVLSALRYRPVFTVSLVPAVAMGGRIARSDRVLCGVLVLVTVASVLVSVSSACAPESEGARPRRMTPEEFPEAYNSSLDRDKVSKQNTLLRNFTCNDYSCYSLVTPFIKYQSYYLVLRYFIIYWKLIWKFNLRYVEIMIWNST